MERTVPDRIAADRRGDIMNGNGVPSFQDRVPGGRLAPATLNTIQVNTGLLCNQTCVHCHVESSPLRKEMMDWSVMQAILDVAKATRCELVDITGGAPELHPDFRRFVTALTKGGHAVQVRTNLTVLLLPKMKEMPGFFREQRVRLVASLPCYLAENVSKQRGEGVFEKSVEAISALNGIGYGVEPNLPLSLVYNPVGPHLPPPQAKLEEDYRRELRQRHRIEFTRLLTIANMPIGRFTEDLMQQGRYEDYMNLLVDSFNPETVSGLMCRHQISVRWDGTLFDCDFNLALGLPASARGRSHIRDFDAAQLLKRRIVTGGHCYGCTAGAGSSCGGALV